MVVTFPADSEPCPAHLRRRTSPNQDEPKDPGGDPVRHQLHPGLRPGVLLRTIVLVVVVPVLAQSRFRRWTGPPVRTSVGVSRRRRRRDLGSTSPRDGGIGP